MAEQQLAAVCHELRSPLNAIKCWAHVLESQLGDSDPAARRALAGIAIAIAQQARLIDGLLDVMPATTDESDARNQVMRRVED
jgi:signal transduction histidine kinase